MSRARGKMDIPKTILPWQAAIRLALGHLLDAEKRRHKFNEKEAMIPPRYDGVYLQGV
jgi:hypothetical protein